MIRGTIDSYSLEDFDRMLAVNVRAAFVGIQAASQAMKDGGRIILIGSNTAVRTAFPGASVYSMTKAALTGLVRGAAIDLAPRTITVNMPESPPEGAWDLCVCWVPQGADFKLNDQADILI